MPEETNAERLEMTETNTEALKGLKYSAMIASRTVSKHTSVSLGVLTWAVEQAERVRDLELLLEGNDGMSVKEIRHQFVGLHQSVLILENENNRMHRVIGKAVAHFRQDEHRIGMSILESELEVWK